MGLNLDLFIDNKIIKRSRMYKNMKLKALFFKQSLCFYTVYKLRMCTRSGGQKYKTCIILMYKMTNTGMT